MMRKSLLTASLALLLGGAALPALAQPAALQAVPQLDLPRYMGTWHEIASYPAWFQKHCAGASRADYHLQADGRVQVLNRCRQADGRLRYAVAEGRRVGEEGAATLKVRFAPAWLSFIPAVWGDYWVVDIDADYQLVAVSEPRREYLWVLSRQPQVDEAAYAALLERLAAKGFDLTRLQRTAR